MSNELYNQKQFASSASSLSRQIRPSVEGFYLDDAHVIPHAQELAIGVDLCAVRKVVETAGSTQFTSSHSSMQGNVRGACQRQVVRRCLAEVDPGDRCRMCLRLAMGNSLRGGIWAAI